MTCPFRKVLVTWSDLQVVEMNLLPGESLPKETHSNVVQRYQVLEGFGVASMGDTFFKIWPNEKGIITEGVEHGFWNVTDCVLKMIFVYSPSVHPEYLVQERSTDASFTDLLKMRESGKEGSDYASAINFYSKSATEDEFERLVRWLKTIEELK